MLTTLCLSILSSCWLLLGCLGVAACAAAIMRWQSQSFFRMRHGIKQSFTIIDLELPASKGEICELLANINELPSAESRKVRGRLRGQLLVDFVFMAGVYPGTFLLCMRAAHLALAMQKFFLGLAYAQCIAWICDIVENAVLLFLMWRPRELTQTGFITYLVVVVIKWALVLLGIACALSILSYFWLTGHPLCPAC